MSEDDGNIGDIQCWGGDAENCSGRLGCPDGDAVEADAEENDEPDGVDGGVGIFVDFG